MLHGINDDTNPTVGQSAQPSAVLLQVSPGSEGAGQRAAGHRGQRVPTEEASLAGPGELSPEVLHRGSFGLARECPEMWTGAVVIGTGGLSGM